MPMLVMLVLTNCQKDETVPLEDSTETANSEISVKTLTLEQAGADFHDLMEQLGLSTNLSPDNPNGLQQARGTMDTLGLTVSTDIIKQYTRGSYTSYTMELLGGRDPAVFYNLTIESNGRWNGMFATKYSPTTRWMDTKAGPYEGEVQSARVNALTQYTVPDDAFEEGVIYSGVPDFSPGSGGGTPSNASPYYPSDCGGIVGVFYETITVMCGCAEPPHYPGGCRDCSSPGYYADIPYYYCQEYNPNEVDWPGDSGGTGGVSMPDPADLPSVAMAIRPEECVQRIPGDLDGDCQLDAYEICMLGGHGHDVCACVADGGNLYDCSIENCLGYMPQNNLSSAQIQSIYDFLDDNDCSNEAKAFTELALEAWPDGEVDFEERVINNIDNECGKNIFSKIEDGIYEEDILSPKVSVPNEPLELNFSESIITLFNSIPNLEYYIEDDNLVGKNASTTFSGGNIITTLSENYLNNATKLSIARTIIHELVHGWLSARFDLPVTTNSIAFKFGMEQYAQDNGYNPYGTPAEINLFHHEFMSQYINAMAFSLYEWDRDYGTGGNLGWDYYKNMSYGGMYYYDSSNNLIFTDSFIELVPNLNDRNNIVNILINEQEGNNQALGSNCN